MYIICHYQALLCEVNQWAAGSSEAFLMFQDNANLVLKVGLDRDLQTVGDALAVLPHIVDEQTAEGCHAVANRET